MFGFLKAKTPSHPLDGGDPWNVQPTPLVGQGPEQLPAG